MAKKAFFSFHYDLDNWRASQVRNMGMVEGNIPVSDNDWEKVTRGGDQAIKNWIAGQLKGRVCTVVLVGEYTASRKWVKYEIEESWNANRGVVGIHIHGLKNRSGDQGTKGKNPFENVFINGKKLSSIVKLYDTPYVSSTYVYDYIKENMAAWVDEAIKIRADNRL
jgi:hypothetical protein